MPHESGPNQVVTKMNQSGVRVDTQVKHNNDTQDIRLIQITIHLGPFWPLLSIFRFPRMLVNCKLRQHDKKHTSLGHPKTMRVEYICTLQMLPAELHLPLAFLVGGAPLATDSLEAVFDEAAFFWKGKIKQPRNTSKQWHQAAGWAALDPWQYNKTSYDISAHAKIVWNCNLRKVKNITVTHSPFLPFPVPWLAMNDKCVVLLINKMTLS